MGIFDIFSSAEELGPNEIHCWCEVDKEWTVVSKRKGNKKCPLCGLNVVVEDGKAEHDEIEWVKCETSGEWVAVSIELDDVFDCDACDGHIEVHEGEPIHFPPVESLICPVNPDEDAFEVELDGEIHICPHCDAYVLTADGWAEHQEVVPVECTLNPGEFTYVQIDDDDEGIWECQVCGSIITQDDDGFPVHEVVLDHLRQSRSGKDLILVHGFLNDADKDYSSWLKEIKKLNWKGNIWGYQWYSNGWLIKLTKMLIAMGKGSAATIIAALFLTAYRKSRKDSEYEAERLAQAIAERLEAGNSVTVLGFSLGCRVILYALRRLGRWGYKNRVRVILCGGAVPISESWRTQSIAKLVCYHSDGDWVLQSLFHGGEVSLDPAIGVEGLKKRDTKKCFNVHAEGEDGLVIGHVWDRYEDHFSEFGKII